MALARKILSSTPSPVPPQYSMELQFLVMKLLEKEMARRPTTAQILHYSPIRTRIRDVHRACPQLTRSGGSTAEVTEAAGGGADRGAHECGSAQATRTAGRLERRAERRHPQRQRGRQDAFGVASR